MTSKRGLDRRREDPKLGNINHDEHDQPRLPYGGLSGFRAAVPVSRRFLWKGFHNQPSSFGAEALLPVAQTCPSRISTAMTSKARGGGP